MATVVVVSVHLFSHFGPGWVAPFVAVRTLAPACSTPFVMAAAGRRAPSRALTAAAAAAGASTAATAVIVGTSGPAWTIVVLGGVTGIALCCLRPLVIALLPCHINGPSQLLATNSFAALADNASTLAGPLLAAAALATLGPAAALWGSAALLAFTAASMHTLGTAEGAGPPPEVDHRGGVVRAAVDGLRVLADGPLRLVTLLTAGQTFVRGALNVLVVSLAIEQLGMGDGGVGVLLGAIGVGGLIGLPIAVRIAQAGGMGRGLGVALVLWGVPIVAAAMASGPVVAVALFAVVGLGNDLVDITSDTLLQRLVPHAQLSSVLGAFDAVLYAGMGLGALVAGRLTAHVDVRTALELVGLLLPALVIVSWTWLRQLDGHVRERDADVALLQVHGIFSPLVMSTLDHLVGTMQLDSYDDGDHIIRKGDEGDCFVLIEDGEVEVVDDGEVVAVLGPGEGFGEIALLDGAPRNASVVARTSVRVRSLPRDDFLAAIRSHGSARDAAHQLADRRRR